MLFYSFQEQAADYGIDWSGPVVSDDEDERRVIVPYTPTLLSARQLSVLKSLVDPLRHCDDFGKRYYVATRQIVREMVMI